MATASRESKCLAEGTNRLATIFEDTVGWSTQAIILPGTNVSDCEHYWTHNYRCPDVAVFLPGNPATNCGTPWCGAPDFAAEIVSDDDRARDKIPFYAKVRTRELFIIDRNPWSLELLRLDGRELTAVDKLAMGSGGILTSEVLPLTFALTSGQGRPVIRVHRTSDNRTWDV